MKIISGGTPPWWCMKQFKCDRCGQIVQFELLDAGRHLTIEGSAIAYSCSACGTTHIEGEPIEPRTPTHVLHGHY